MRLNSYNLVLCEVESDCIFMMCRLYSLILSFCGSVSEWLKEAVLKTVEGLRLP